MYSSENESGPECIGAVISVDESTSSDPLCREVTSCSWSDGDEVGGAARTVALLVLLPFKTVASEANGRNDLLSDDQTAISSPASQNGEFYW